MKVFVATRGEYDEYEVIGVFSSPEAFASFLNKEELQRLVVAYPKAVSLGAGGSHLNCPPKSHDFNPLIECEVDGLPPLRWSHTPTQARLEVPHDYFVLIVPKAALVIHPA